MEKKMKAFILSRQSSGESNEEDSLSISVQVEECLKLAKSRDVDVIDIFKESATSGRLYPTGYEMIAAHDIIYAAWCRETKKTNQWRAGLGEILKRLNEVDYIIAYDITRFFRPLNGSLLGSLLTQTVQAANVKLLTIKEGIVDFSRFQDSLISSLTSQINSEQLRTQTEKSKAAYARLMNSGDYYPCLPRMFGYRPTGRKREVMIEEREAKMVKDIFRMFNASVPVSHIMQTINADYKDVFKGLCNRYTIMRILKKPAYCGLQYNKEHELIKSNQLIGKNIISVEEWKNAMMKLEKNKIGSRRPKKNWLPLSGLVYCGHCGKKMIVHGPRRGRKAFYLCAENVKTGRPKCDNNTCMTVDCRDGIGLIEVVKPLLIAEAMKRMKAAKDNSTDREELSSVEISLAEIRRKMKKLTDMWLGSIIAEDVYDSSMKEVKAKESELMKKKNSLELALSADTSQFDWAKMMMKFRGDGLTRGEYEQLANLMLKKITVYKDFVSISTTYGDVDIPKQRLSRLSLCLNYIIQMHGRKAAVYFYYGKARHLQSASLNEAAKIAKLGELDIFIVEA